MCGDGMKRVGGKCVLYHVNVCIVYSPQYWEGVVHILHRNNLHIIDTPTW